MFGDGQALNEWLLTLLMFEGPRDMLAPSLRFSIPLLNEFVFLLVCLLNGTLVASVSASTGDMIGSVKGDDERGRSSRHKETGSAGLVWLERCTRWWKLLR